MESTTFACAQCEKSYNRKFNLTRHTEEKHTLNKTQTHRNWFKCDLCHHTCDPRNKVRHIKAKHNENTVKKQQKKPACSQCDKEFHCKSNLNRHTYRFHARTKKTFTETIIESESEILKNCTEVGKDMLDFPSESESDSQDAENALNEMCHVSDHGKGSEDFVNQDQTQPDLHVKDVKDAQKMLLTIEVEWSEGESVDDLERREVIIGQEKKTESGKNKESESVDEVGGQERGGETIGKEKRTESEKENENERESEFEQKLKKLERATRACRLNSKAVDELNGEAKRRTWKQEMELLKKRFQDEREADDSALVEKDIFVKALNLMRCDVHNLS